LAFHNRQSQYLANSSSSLPQEPSPRSVSLSFSNQTNRISPNLNSDFQQDQENSCDDSSEEEGKDDANGKIGGKVVPL
jgi:hypothetical protein